VSLFLVSGCFLDSDRDAEPPPGTPSFRGVILRVAAVGDPAILAGLSAQRGEWVASRGGEISISEQPADSPERLSEADLVIFPGQEMGNLVDADVLETIPNQAVLPPQPPEDESGKPREVEGTPEPPADPFQYNDIAPAYRDQVTRYGTDRMALPLGGSALVLVYRRDAFTRPANIEAAGKAGIRLEPPATWAQLDTLAKFLSGRDWDGDGSPDHGLVAVLGTDPEGVGDATFLARAASLGQHRDQYSFLFDADSMAPRIDSPPFVEALAGVASWKEVGPPGMEKFDAAAAREAFRKGKTALLIDRAERAATWSGGHPLGVAPLPGSERVFEPLRKTWENPSSPNTPSYLPHGGGWLVGVRRGLTGPRREAAIDLARYLASPENANRLRAERSFPMLPVRSTQMGQGLPDPTSAPDVDPRQWTEAVSRTLMAGRVVPGLRIPDAAGYLADLAKARVAAVSRKDSASALHGLAAAWTERTKARGTQRQLWHYRRSLNSLATLPQPPQRGK
jgi:multiple sugar transport system substrate-binding protein